MKAAVARAGLALAAFSIARAAPAQIAANRATAYLVPTDVSDARALWVNPAGLAVTPEASVMLDLAVVDPGVRGRLGQVSAGFNARGLGFGYQRDNFPTGEHGHTYRLALAGSSRRLAAGFAVALYRGAASGTGWDLGVRYDWLRAITIGGVVEHLGRPSALGARQEVTYIPAITARPIQAALALSARAAFTATGARGYGLQASAELPGRPTLGILARVDTDRSWRRTALTLGVSLGNRDRVGMTASTLGDLSRLRTASLYGVSSRSPSR